MFSIIFILEFKLMNAIKTKNDAAIKIQSAVRNRKALKELYKLEDKDKAMEAAVNKYNGISVI